MLKARNRPAKRRTKPAGGLQHRRPTVVEVAQRAGVSVGTVSNVLNGANAVSEARRLRVEKAIVELGYSQNLLAQGLRRRRSTVVGLCVPHTTNAYFSAMMTAFEELASDRGFELMQVLSGQDPKREYKRVEALLRYKIGGLLLVPTRAPGATLDMLARSGTPTVIVDRPAHDDRFDEVSFDNRRAMAEATRWMIAMGHRRFLFMVRERALVVTKQRVIGLTAAARESGEKVTTEVVECPSDEVMVTASLASRFRRPNPPTAVIVSNSTFAALTLRAFRSLKLDYPRSVSLMAFDAPEWGDLVTPRLSVVRQPTLAIARKAWELLIARMTGERTRIQREEFLAEVVIRDSVVPLSDSKR
ncbi:MAG: LacI family DNA-binding transcriptional regulator [Alphaproteobacteria bacterium]|nr:LacI family DNA-binding transcriptional regulator [Alphaproteobacteria bacterium]